MSRDVIGKFRKPEEQPPSISLPCLFFLIEAIIVILSFSQGGNQFGYKVLLYG